MRVLCVTALTALLALAAPMAAAAVKTAALSEIAPPSRYEFAAAVVSANDSQLASEVSAKIESVHADVGAHVEKGQVLVELDRRDAELVVQQAAAQLKAALAQLKLAEQRLIRGKELRQRDFIADDDLLALQTQLDAAEAERDIRAAGLANAQRQRDKCTIRAPFDGAVQARMAQVGSLAMPGTPLIRLVATAAAEVEAALPDGVPIELDDSTAESGVDSIDNHRTDGSLRYQFLYRGRALALRPLRLSAVIDGGSRTRLARFGFVESAAAPGSSGSLSISGRGFGLPSGLLIERGGRLGTFVVEAGKARFRVVDGALPGRSVEVNWPADTQLVVEGQLSIEDGQAIDPSPTL